MRKFLVDLLTEAGIAVAKRIAKAIIDNLNDKSV